ncbi:MAG: preprotein translocase subunit SecE [Clostridia bacterium]|nr:preprotein translocase subunit SecE [Clostridia bacterium]MBO7288496.1 preprotein translocase subunit SecE [Clostridia bacterium]
MAEATASKKKSGNKIVRFFKELKSELKKVVWPSKKQVIKNSLIVIAAVIIIGIVIWVLDLAFGFGISKLIK